MSVKTAQALVVQFTTANPVTGAAQDADVLPSATLVVNGADNGATVTVADIGVGLYTGSVTCPALTAGQTVQIRVNATVGGVAGAGVVFTDIADTKLPSDVFTAVGSPMQAGTSVAVSDKTGFSLHADYDHAKDDISDDLAAIKAKTDTIGSADVTIVSPVADDGETITFYRGDDYYAADGRSIDIVVSGAPDLTSGSVSLVIGRLEIVGEILSSGAGADQSVRFEPTAVQVERLTAGTHRWMLRATLANGHKVSPANGPCHVSAV